MPDNLDQTFGAVRAPDSISDWEKDKQPLSLVQLDEAAGELRGLVPLAQTKLLGFAMRAQSYIWAMTADGTIWIAVEELAFHEQDFPHQGYPRRKGSRHPSDERKLGHPTLVAGGEVRIAGELVFDELEGGTIGWVINASSGRYCRQMPPTPAQLDAVAVKFEELGIRALVDYD